MPTVLPTIVDCRHWTKQASWIFLPGSTPRIIWRDVDEIRQLGGDVNFRVRWFNSQLEEFPKPKESGRWIAWIEGTSPNEPYRRLCFVIHQAYGSDITGTNIDLDYRCWVALKKSSRRSVRTHCEAFQRDLFACRQLIRVSRPRTSFVGEPEM